MIWMPRNPSLFHLFPSVFHSIFTEFTFSLHLSLPLSLSPRGAARNSLAWKFYDSNLRVSLHAQTSRHHLNLSFTRAHTRTHTHTHTRTHTQGMMGAAAAGLLGAIDKHMTNALDEKYSGTLLPKCIYKLLTFFKYSFWISLIWPD